MTKTANKHTFTVEEIVKFLKNESDNETMEGKLLRTKLIRELYKQLGDPTKEDFGKEMEPAGTYWEKMRGYTTYIEFVRDKDYIKQYNNSPNDWGIKRPSETKVQIVERYNRNNWHAQIQAFNVICTKYVQHPKYKDILVLFYASRDCNKYEYVIVRGK